MRIAVYISYGSDGDELLDAQAHATREEAADRIKTSYESYLTEGDYDYDESFCSETSAQIAFKDRSWIYLQVMESAIEVTLPVLRGDSVA